jgi:hypothetical protein
MADSNNPTPRKPGRTIARLVEEVDLAPVPLTMNKNDFARDSAAWVAAEQRMHVLLVPIAKRLAHDEQAPYYGFPLEHRRQVWSTNSVERPNKEVSRRCDVVGIFPSRNSLLRLAGALLEEQSDEWAVGRRYFSTESMNKPYQPSHEEVVQALLELQSA